MKFEGIIPALVTPFNSQDEVDYAMVKKLVSALVREPIGGLFVCGSTGEWWYLTNEERMKLLEAVLETVAGRLPVMVHVGTLSTRASQTLARHAERAGASAISLLPPIGVNYTAEAIWKHFKAVADTCDLPLYLYHLPQFYGDLITVDKFIEALDTIPTLAGAKFSSYRVDDLINLKLKAKGRLNLLSGCGEQLLSATVNGAEGSICTWYNVIPRLAHEIVACVKRGDIPAASRYQDLLVEFGMICKENPIATVKRMLTHRGYEVGCPRAPMPALSNEGWAKLLPAIQTIGILDWCIADAAG